MIHTPLSQRYFLCAVNGSESFDVRDSKGEFGLVAAALLELDLAGVIAVNDKKLYTCAPLAVDGEPLAPLYDHIARKGPLSVGRLARSFAVRNLLLPARADDPLLGQLQQRLGAALAARGLATKREGDKRFALPTPEAAQAEFDRLREALITKTAPLDEDTAALALLLDKTEVLSAHFSADECRQMRETLAAAAQSDAAARALQAMQHFEWIWRLCMASAFLPF